MSSNLSKILTAVILVIATIGVVLFARIFFVDEAELNVSPELQNSIVSPLVGFSTFLLYASVAVAAFFSVATIFKQPENIKKVGINIGILGAIYAIAYVLASDSAVLDVQGQVLEGGEAGATSKLVSTIINYSTYLGVIALGTVVWGAVKSALKS